MNYDVGNKIITKHKWRLVMVSLRRRRQCDDGWKWKSRFVQPSRNQFNYYNDVLILWHCHLRGEEWKTQIMNSTLAKDERTNERTNKNLSHHRSVAHDWFAATCETSVCVEIERMWTPEQVYMWIYTANRLYSQQTNTTLTSKWHMQMTITPLTSCCIRTVHTFLLCSLWEVRN